MENKQTFHFLKQNPNIVSSTSGKSRRIFKTENAITLKMVQQREHQQLSNYGLTSLSSRGQRSPYLVLHPRWHSHLVLIGWQILHSWKPSPNSDLVALVQKLLLERNPSRCCLCCRENSKHYPIHQFHRFWLPLERLWRSKLKLPSFLCLLA